MIFFARTSPHRFKDALLCIPAKRAPKGALLIRSAPLQGNLWGLVQRTQSVPLEHLCSGIATTTPRSHAQ